MSWPKTITQISLLPVPPPGFSVPFSIFLLRLLFFLPFKIDGRPLALDVRAPLLVVLEVLPHADARAASVVGVPLLLEEFLVGLLFLGLS